MSLLHNGRLRIRRTKEGGAALLAAVSVLSPPMLSRSLAVGVGVTLAGGALTAAKPAHAALPPGFYDLGKGQGVIVMRSNAANNFASDILFGAPLLSGALALVVGSTFAGKVAWLINTLYWMVPAYRIQQCATRYGAPYVYIYTIWGGLPIWADPAW